MKQNRNGRRADAETAQIFSIRCSAEQLFRSGGGKLYFTIGDFTADTSARTGIGLSVVRVKEPRVHSDSRRRILLSEEPHFDGGL